MKVNETRENKMIDAVETPADVRRVCIVNGPVVLPAAHSEEGQRRFVVIAGTLVLDESDPIAAHDRTLPLRRTLLQQRRGPNPELFT